MILKPENHGLNSKDIGTVHTCTQLTKSMSSIPFLYNVLDFYVQQYQSVINAYKEIIILLHRLKFNCINLSVSHVLEFLQDIREKHHQIQILWNNSVFVPPFIRTQIFNENLVIYKENAYIENPIPCFQSLFDLPSFLKNTWMMIDTHHRHIQWMGYKTSISSYWIKSFDYHSITICIKNKHKKHYNCFYIPSWNIFLKLKYCIRKTSFQITLPFDSNSPIFHEILNEINGDIHLYYLPTVPFSRFEDITLEDHLCNTYVLRRLTNDHDWQYHTYNCHNNTTISSSVSIVQIKHIQCFFSREIVSHIQTLLHLYCRVIHRIQEYISRKENQQERIRIIEKKMVDTLYYHMNKC
jgi:hypothetical protein